MRSQFEDYRFYESVESGDYHAASGQLLYTVNRYDDGKGRNARFLMLRQLSEEGRKAECLAQDAHSGIFSPDGKSIAYLHRGALYVMDLASREHRELARFPGTVMDPQWSPDGGRIACLAAAAGDIAPDDEPVVIEDFGYKMDGSGFIRSEHMHLWTVAVSDGLSRQLTDGPFDDMQHAWSPDGRELVYVSTKGASRKESLHMNLWRISCDGSGQEQLTSEEWVSSYPTPVRPVYTLDGRNVIFTALDIAKEDPDMESGMPPARLLKVRLEDHFLSVLLRGKSEECCDCVAFPYFHGAPRGLGRLALSEDGRNVYFMGGWKGCCCLYRMDLAGEHGITTLIGGESPAASLSGGEASICVGIGKACHGQLLISVGGVHGPGTLAILNERDDIVQTIDLGLNEWMKERELSVPVDFRIPTLDGEDIIHGWVQPPQGCRRGKRYPAILLIHGGPYPFYTYGFEYMHQCFAGAGYALIYCNPRGSSGYGRRHQNAKRAFDGSAYTDLLQFVDEACRRFDFIDPERIGVTGGSYGGYMTSYMATHSHRFRAYIPQRGLTNELISYASSDMQGESLSYPDFETFMYDKLRDSVVCYAQNICAPILLMHGEDDLRCPVEGAHQFFTAIKDTHRDLPCKLILYPGCAHEIPGDMEQKLHYYHAMLEWFENYV